MQLDNTIQLTFQDAAKKLTEPRKREFIAKVAQDYPGSSIRKADRVFGCNCQSVELGLHEQRTGLIDVDYYRARGRHKSEVILPNLEAELHALVDAQAQADPKFQSTLVYARISASAVRGGLIQRQGYREEQLPTRQIIGEILDRLGYSLSQTLTGTARLEALPPLVTRQKTLLRKTLIGNRSSGWGMG